MAYGLVLVTARDKTEAERIVKGLLEKKFAACCNVVGDVRSFYWWQGKIEDSPEMLIMIKTRRELFGDLVREVKKLHSYSVPEIVMLPVIDGSKDYLQWIDESLS